MLVSHTSVFFCTLILLLLSNDNDIVTKKCYAIETKVLISGRPGTSVPRLFHKVLISHSAHYAISEALRAVCGRGL